VSPARRKTGVTAPTIAPPVVPGAELLDAMSEYRSAARLGQWVEAAQEAGKRFFGCQAFASLTSHGFSNQ